MKITQIKITEDNLLEVVQEPNVYGIITNGLFGRRIVPIKECEVGGLMTGEIPVIEIKEES